MQVFNLGGVGSNPVPRPILIQLFAMPKFTSQFVQKPISAICVIAALCAVTLRGADGVSIDTDSDGARPGTKPISALQDESFDAFLLVAERPLHLKFRVAIDERTPSEVLEQCVVELKKRLDTNGDGKLSTKEFNKSPLVRRIARPKAESFLDSLGPQPMVRTEQVRKQVLVAAGGSPIVIRANKSTAEDDSSIFDLLDIDESGLLEAAELKQAAKILMEKDTDHDRCISFAEFKPAAPQLPGFVGVIGEDESTQATQSDLMILTTATTRLRAEFFKKYDENNDRRLSAEELHWPAELMQQFDTNSDGVLRSNEVQGLESSPVDLELRVNLFADPDKPSSVEVIRVSDNNPRTEVDSGVVSIQCHGISMRLAIRKIDPVAAAIANAMEGFNGLDSDNNGYLDKAEVGERIRMARGLFDMIDVDDDGKVFGKEMEEYVTVAGAPAAATFRVNVYDTGYGFFQNLDANRDGRLSLREMRMVTESLEKLERDGLPGISPTEPVRNYYIEFVRGSFTMFGQRSSLVAPTRDEFTRPSLVGPVWFQRMDRNNDGDLAWEEFLGRRKDFDLLDTDGDGLIDSKEAAAATGA